MLADLPSLLKWWFHRFLVWQLIFHSYSESSYLADLPPLTNSNYRFLLWELIFGRPGFGRSTHPSNSNFTDSCSDSSYFIPTLRAHIWQIRCWQIYPPQQMVITDSYSESTYLADQVLADLTPLSNGIFTDSCSDSSYFIPTLRAHIWQISCWQIYPPLNGNFTDSWSDSSYFILTLRAHIWQIYPPIEWQFDRFLVWQLIFHSYSESSYLADLPPLTNSNYRFLLWELIFGRPSFGRSTHPSNSNFTDSCSDSSYFIPTLRAHIWQISCWQIYPPLNGNFTDSWSDSSYFIPTLRAHIWQIYPHWQIAIIDSYSESSYLADQVLADLPTHQTAISQIPALTAHISFLLWELIFGRSGVGRSTPPTNGDYRFLLWEHIFGRPGVGRSNPPFKWHFHRFLLWQLILHSYSESSYLADQLLADLPPIEWQFHRFLVWQLIFHSYSESSYLADLPSHWMAIWQISGLTAHISFLLWELVFGRSGVGRSTPPKWRLQIPTLRVHIWQTDWWQI